MLVFCVSDSPRCDCGAGQDPRGTISSVCSCVVCTTEFTEQQVEREQVEREQVELEQEEPQQR